ncbi:MAG: phosphoglycerate kinase, partial [Hyphomicrobium sp.]|nr:phosphoglycerate kinase [Hyphomicrobium sp.]
LDRLEADIRVGNLPPTSGFFFGESDGSEVEDDLRFIAKAREAMADGLIVYYSSWW